MTQQDIQSIKQRYGIIGSSPALDRDIEAAVQVAKTRMSVLVTGENGSGKDVFARIIHDFSPRKHGPFFSLNCGAIPEGTINSELFGHVKGSFTGANADHKGYFEICDGGTLFLDEVGELPLSTQALLLRVLENGEFIRVGEAKVQKTNVRVVTATNRNLPQAILDGRFRQDLYYRMNVFEIQVPSLRDRRDDIPLLFRKFASDFSQQNNMPPVRLSEDANQLLKDYYWAGNIRQLRNVTEHVCLMETGTTIGADKLRQYMPDNELNRTPAISSHGQSHGMNGGMSDGERDMLYKILDAMRKDIADMHIQIADLQQAAEHPQVAPRVVSHVNAPHDMIDGSAPIRHASNSDDYEVAEEYREEEEAFSASAIVDKTESLDDLEKRSIRDALIRHHRSRKMAAQELGISERTLYRKIKQYDLDK